MDNYFTRYVQLALAGDDSAFETLYNLTKDQIYYAVMCITKNKDDACNIMQDSYINAFENLSMLETTEYFDLWLNKIVSRNIKIFLKSKDPKLFNDTKSYNISDWDENDNKENLAQESVDDKETKRHISEIVSSLPDDQKLIVIMHYYQEMNVSDIEDAIDMSEEYVKYSLTAARRSMKELIQKLRDDGVLLREVTLSAIPFVLSEEAKTQFLFYPAPPFNELISIASENDEKEPSRNDLSSVYQPPIQTQIPQQFSFGGAVPPSEEPSGDESTDKQYYGFSEDTYSTDESSQEEAAQYPTDIYQETSADSSFSQAFTEKDKTLHHDPDQKADAYEYKSYESNSAADEYDVHENKQVLSDQISDYGGGDRNVSDEFSMYSSPADKGRKAVNTVSFGSRLRSFMSTTVGKITAAALAIVVVGICIVSVITILAKNDSITASDDIPYSSTLPSSSEEPPKSEEPTEEEIQKEDIVNYEYSENNDGTVTITKYKGILENIVIPDTLGGKKVSSIGYKIFENATHIKSITLSKYVNSIITSVDKIDNSPFTECIYLENLNVDTSNLYLSSENGVLYNKNKSQLIVYPSGRKDKTFDIPESVKSIFNGAFSENLMLEEVTFPSGMTEIGEHAFYNCSSLKSIEIPDGITRILEGTFQGCSSLEDVSLPESLEYIEDSAFKECTSLQNIVMPKSLKAIKSDVFMQCSRLDTITIPNPNTVLDEADAENIKYNMGTFYMSPATIKAPKGSRAEKYAQKCKMSFEAL